MPLLYVAIQVTIRIMISAVIRLVRDTIVTRKLPSVTDV